jgi:ADP-L-glycero-D-manno-heptose 6-epimerase
LIILTGSDGFIGSNFKKKLIDVESIEINNKWDFLNTFNKWEKVDCIIHQGAISSTVETDIEKIFENNIKYSIKLLEKAINYGVPVKYASSASVYGMSTEGFNPMNYYALSKLTVDYWVLDNIDKFSLIQGFRYFNVYGNGEDNKKDQASPVSKFTKQAKESGVIKIFNNSENYYRDFICVDDLVDIVLNNDKPSGIYDLGTSHPVSFKYVAECVANKFNSSIEEIPFPEHLKNKYQEYTCAKKNWDYKFTTIKEYLDKNYE